MTTLYTDEQLKAFYTQKELVELVELKNKFLPIKYLPTGYKRLNKTALVAVIRALDTAINGMSEAAIAAAVQADKLERQEAAAEEKLGTFIEAKREAAGLTLLDVRDMTGITVDDQIQIEWNQRYPSERELMQYRSINFLPEEEEAEELDQRTCEVCGKDITAGGFLAEWSGDTFCSIEHAEVVLNYDEINEGQQDGSFFYTDWLDEDSALPPFVEVIVVKS